MANEYLSANPSPTGTAIHIAANKSSRSNLLKFLGRTTYIDKADVQISDLCFTTEQDRKIEHLISLRAARVFGLHSQWQLQIKRCLIFGFSLLEVKRISQLSRIQHIDPSVSLLCKIVDQSAQTTEISDELIDSLLEIFGTQKSAKILALLDWWNTLRGSLL